ncbi:hypothetical protein [Weissella soli]|uniref:hypothetical protein n=1 Tax=Weissella soli TaxID=155866 RepID=UPI0035A156C5
MFKFNSKKFKVAVVVILSTIAVSTTATATWQMWKVDPNSNSEVVASATTSVNNVLGLAKTQIDNLKKAVQARTQERDTILNTANDRIKTANDKIDVAASSAKTLETTASSLQTSIDDSKSEASNTTADTYINEVSVTPVNPTSSASSSN